MYQYLKNAVKALQGRRATSVKDENLAEISRRSCGGGRTVFISSYPRSGNTWLRRLLSDCFIQNMGYETTVDLPVSPDKIIPDCYRNPIVECEVSINTFGLFVKSHDSFDDIRDSLPMANHRTISYIYLLRSPEDALVSYYHFQRRYAHLDSQTSAGIDAFCRTHLSEWCDNVMSYLEAKKRDPCRLFFVSYETLLADPVALLESLFGWLDIRIQKTMVEQAVSNHRFEKLRRMEERNPLISVETKNPLRNEFFYRRGRSGGGEEELQTSTLEEIRRRTSGMMDETRRFESVNAAAF